MVLDLNIPIDSDDEYEGSFDLNAVYDSDNTNSNITPARAGDDVDSSTPMSVTTPTSSTNEGLSNEGISNEGLSSEGLKEDKVDIETEGESEAETEYSGDETTDLTTEVRSNAQQNEVELVTSFSLLDLLI
jgi:hypothetical protein